MGTSMRAGKGWRGLPTAWLPFADVGTEEVPLKRLLRLSLFQLSVGMVATLFYGTLNRVMIVELKVPASIVAVMVALPLLVAPFRVLIGFRSDTHRSLLGWRRVPYLWIGTLFQWMGLAIMPFALLVLSDPFFPWARSVGAAASGLAFLCVGYGAHTTQTAGLALATDLAPESKRGRVVALMYLMFLVGTVISALGLGLALENFSAVRLIRVIHSTAALTLWINLFALWQQEPRRPGITPYKKGEPRPLFREAWARFTAGGQVIRLLVAVGLGFLAFNLQDVLLEPYGGEILGMSVGATTSLTGLMALGAVVSFAMSARLLERGWDPTRLAMVGAIIGVVAFALVLVASLMHAPLVFRIGATLIGFGEATFGVGTLTYAMGLKGDADSGLALGAWGAVFATGEGIGLASSGLIKDGLSHLVGRGWFSSISDPRVLPYNVVYGLEILVLIVTVLALWPLLGARRVDPERGRQFELADIPS